MKSGAARTVFTVLILTIILLSATVAAADETGFQVESTDLQIYRDGLVRVTQTLTVNETFPMVTFTLLSSLVDNFIVLDENQTVLDYEIDGVNLTVFTLGATNVSVQYDTHSLTMKDAAEWTFLVDSPYNITAILPKESTIIYLSEAPASINTDRNTITLYLFANQWEISYIFPLVPPADFQISNLEVTPSDAKAGEEVTVSVTVTNVGGQTGSYTLPLIINQITEETKTVTLDSGESAIVTFKVIKQTLGTYNIEVSSMFGAFAVSADSSNGATSNPIPIEYLVVVVAAVAAVLFVVFILFRRRRVNIDKIFKQYPQLNTEEMDVIQFLAFESQIREQFPDIPRTSLWRLVKRLEKLEIVKVKKIGLENQVELKK